ncbi:MAG: 2-oxoacid:ferredoxin oxidoreductase subunit gamma [Chloroflexota bacterium]|nr:MAG: 2-oxoacid:ferredoxin oxidoreductase subunit gamma [Chloroflexota bacterium]
METSVVIAGFGGQGILVAGQLLSYGAIIEGRNVTFWPAYGAETRGGTVHCTVTLSDEEIGSPIVPNPDAAIIMNRPSLDRYEPQLKSGGLLVYNSSMIDRQPQRQDLHLLSVPATEQASEMGSLLVATLVAVGAYLAAAKVLNPASVKSALRKVIPEGRHHLLGMNEQALDRGIAIY